MIAAALVLVSLGVRAADAAAELDERVVRRAIELPTWLDVPLEALMAFASALVALAVTVGTGALARRIDIIVAGLIGAPVAYALSLAGKATFEFARPTLGPGRVVRTAVDGFGWPSGHATMAAYLAIVLVVGFRRRQRWPVVVATAYVAAVAVGRVVLGAHYVSDVVGGVGVGMLGAALGLAFGNLARRPQNART